MFLVSKKELVLYLLRAFFLGGFIVFPIFYPVFSVLRSKESPEGEENSFTASA